VTPVRQCAYVLCARVFCFSLCVGSNIHEGRAHNKHASLFFKNKRLLSPAGLKDFFPRALSSQQAISLRFLVRGARESEQMMFLTGYGGCG